MKLQLGGNRAEEMAALAIRLRLEVQAVLAAIAVVGALVMPRPTLDLAVFMDLRHRRQRNLLNRYSGFVTSSMRV